MAHNPRIEDLRRRIQLDPASIAFAQLAEEHRRGGNYEEAIATCRAGLAIHPDFLSARITLGRALIEVNDLEAAEEELEHVLQSAPENLAAIRGLGEVHYCRGRLGEALAFYQTALNLARHDPDLEQTVDEIARAITSDREPTAAGPSFEQATAEFLSALDVFEAAPAGPVAPVEPPALPGLEKFLGAIHTYRQRQAV
ncbi:MAG TPA: tetratricopeptide repeat protein [Vicinamibacterales bacterium]|nr:tetratricopeptide repeat protein [Vicinamibacterales bacterium]